MSRVRSPIRRSPRASLARPLTAAVLVAVSLVITLGHPVPAGSSTHDFADPIFSTDARGDIVTIGNVTTTCDPDYVNANWSRAESTAACNGSTSGATGVTRFDGTAMPPINNRLSMEYVDVDSDATTFNSSMARLRIPAGSTVLWAGLHWNAATDVQPAAQLYGSTYQQPPVDVADRYQVRIDTPSGGGYTRLDASSADGTTRDVWDNTDPGGTTSFGAYADVTGLVRSGGSGDYTVADVQSCRGFGGCFGSWSLTVAFAHPDLPPRNLNVWHGWQLTTPTVNDGAQEFTVNGITPPPSGPVNARIGVVQADGDRGLGPDSLDISSPSNPRWHTFATVDRPLASGEQDWFNSTVNSFGRRRPNTDARPNLLANLDQDIALVEDDQVISNNDRAFSFRVKTASTESLFSQVVHSAVDLYEPEISLTKGVTPPGPVHPGDEATWTLTAANIGIDPIRHAVVTDPLPDDVTYVPGSIRFERGGPAAILGPKTDAGGDDQAEWDAATRTLTFRVGAGADAGTGGTMGLAPAADGSDTLTITFRTVVDAAPGSEVNNTAHGHGEGRALSDSFGPLTTDDDDRASIAAAPEADLGITKSDGDALVRAVGDRFTYALTATNGGPSPATGVVMTDDLDPMLRFVDSSDGCTAVGQVVTCPVGALAVDASAGRTFVVEVVELPGPGHDIPNVATVDGSEPNADCAEPTADALCNHDQEETPQPSIDLGITKTDDDAVVRAVGDTFTYRLEVTNAGPDDATGVRIDDPLDPRLAFVGSDECHATRQQIRCDIGDLVAGASAVATVDVRVLRLPEPGRSIPNLATVAATESDPDCVDPTPDALCNHDEEETPRPPTAPTTTTTAAPQPAPRGPGGPPLPRTGTDVRVLLSAAGVALAAGVLAMVVRRRLAPRRAC